MASAFSFATSLTEIVFIHGFSIGFNRVFICPFLVKVFVRIASIIGLRVFEMKVWIGTQIKHIIVVCVSTHSHGDDLNNSRSMTISCAFGSPKPAANASGSVPSRVTWCRPCPRLYHQTFVLCFVGSPGWKVRFGYFNTKNDRQILAAVFHASKRATPSPMKLNATFSFFCWMPKPTPVMVQAAMLKETQQIKHADKSQMQILTIEELS